jgi:K+-sensing histidine kinase KdpD
VKRKSEQQLPKAAHRATALRSYAASLLLVFLVTVFRLAFLRVLGNDSPYILYYLAVTVAALYGGLRAGVLAIALSTLAAVYFFMPPTLRIAIERPQNIVATVIFVLSTILIATLAEILLRTRKRLLAYRDHLEELVDSRTAQLQAENAERKDAEMRLTATNQELEAFSYSVSHDLRAPLDAAGGFVSLLQQHHDHQLDESGRLYLARIATGIDTAKRLIAAILSLSRIGRQELRRQEVDLSRIVRDVLEELNRAQPERVVAFVVQDGVRAAADPDLIRIALYNLLANAWKFTSRQAHPRIEFGENPQSDEPVYFLRDNGAGFDMGLAKMLFEPFKRLHSQKEFGGIGVGLSMVQRVIQRHGGRIWAEGTPGSGACFYFTLGRQAPARQP